MRENDEDVAGVTPDDDEDPIDAVEVSGDDGSEADDVGGETDDAVGGAGDDELTHTTESGDVQMVDVGDKPDTGRRAVARGEIHLTASTVDAVRDDEIGKGDVLSTARVGAIQAVKHTWETIPMCHQIPITNVDTAFDVWDDRIELQVAVVTTGKTGCEMEAIQGVTTGLGVVWDMVKAAEKEVVDESETVEASGYPGTKISGVEVVSKEKRDLS
ncbi:MAG: cyclic pyranopterin monophosphate synthase MoaC [Halanaeroarchaeum sp.]